MKGYRKLPQRAPIYMVMVRQPGATDYQIVKFGQGQMAKYYGLYREYASRGIPARFLVVGAKTNIQKQQSEAGNSTWAKSQTTKE